jgi:hypothetical protein
MRTQRQSGLFFIHLLPLRPMKALIASQARCQATHRTARSALSSAFMVNSDFFGNFWLTIQNTTNRHVSNAFDLPGVFISFPLARAAAAVAAADFCCCCCAHRPHPAPF